MGKAYKIFETMEAAVSEATSWAGSGVDVQIIQGEKEIRALMRHRAPTERRVLFDELEDSRDRLPRRSRTELPGAFAVLVVMGATPASEDDAIEHLAKGYTTLPPEDASYFEHLNKDD